MKKYLFYSMMVAIALCATACNKNKSDVEDKTQESNPYPYLRISDVEIYYEKTISEAEDMLYKKGYKGGFITDKIGYKYCKGNDTIVLECNKEQVVRRVGYTSAFKATLSEIKEWLLHPTATYQGIYNLSFQRCMSVSLDTFDYSVYKNFIDVELNNDTEVVSVWDNHDDEKKPVWCELIFNFEGNHGISMYYGDGPQTNPKPELEPSVCIQ